MRIEFASINKKCFFASEVVTYEDGERLVVSWDTLRQEVGWTSNKKLRTYNPNKGCKDLTQRRKGVEKARKEKYFKKRE